MPKRLMPRLRRLFARAALEREEVNILRGILARVDEILGRGTRSARRVASDSCADAAPCAHR